MLHLIASKCISPLPVSCKRRQLLLLRRSLLYKKPHSPRSARNSASNLHLKKCMSSKRKSSPIDCTWGWHDASNGEIREAAKLSALQKWVNVTAQETDAVASNIQGFHRHWSKGVCSNVDGSLFQIDSNYICVTLYYINIHCRYSTA